MTDEFSPRNDETRKEATLRLLEIAQRDTLAGAVQELSEAVRVVMAMGYQPTLTAGDALGPFVFGDSLVTYYVEAVEVRGFHALGEAERMAGAVSESGRQVVVVRYDRIYNVVRLSDTLESHKIVDLNLHLEMRRRYKTTHRSADGFAPRIVSLASRGYAFTSATPRIQAVPPLSESALDSPENESWMFGLGDPYEPRNWQPHVIDIVAPHDLVTNDIQP